MPENGSYTAPVCRCGHAIGDHATRAVSSFPHPAQYGPCLACDCCARFTAPAPMLVRVSTPLLELLERGEAEPVVLLGAERQDDGTYELVLRSVVRHEPRLAALLKASQELDAAGCHVAASEAQRAATALAKLRGGS